MRERFVILRGEDRLAAGNLLNLVIAAVNSGEHHQHIPKAFDVPQISVLRWVESLNNSLSPDSAESEVRVLQCGPDGRILQLELHPGPLETAFAVDFFHAGNTIVFQKVDAKNPAWWRIANAFEMHTGQPAQVNIYAGAPDTNGLDWHRDPHDVLVMQLAGNKTFYIATSITDGQKGASTSVTLDAGSVLYLRRGTAHKALNSSMGSIHAAVGLLHLYPNGEQLERCTNPDSPSCSTGNFETISQQQLGDTVAFLLQWRQALSGMDACENSIKSNPDRFLVLLSNHQETWLISHSGSRQISKQVAEQLESGQYTTFDKGVAGRIPVPSMAPFTHIQDMIDYVKEVHLEKG